MHGNTTHGSTTTSSKTTSSALVGGEAVVVQDTHPALVQVLAHLRAPDVLRDGSGRCTERTTY
eukprot:15725927-Heterocapsa_arctica.AAC.1